jgi:hypothetical protein
VDKHYSIDREEYIIGCGKTYLNISLQLIFKESFAFSIMLVLKLAA